MKYSRVIHASTAYPPHVTAVLPIFLQAVESRLPSEAPRFRRLSYGVDIIYCAEFERGGSIGAHSDNELPWGLVVVFSLGQSRWFRVKHKASNAWFNVEVPHNSVLAMHGADFQPAFTHQIDKLADDEPVGVRLSLNFRFCV
jgi:alkylated DNA repair dioxygenase AlkB